MTGRSSPVDKREHEKNCTCPQIYVELRQSRINAFLPRAQIVLHNRYENKTGGDCTSADRNGTVRHLTFVHFCSLFSKLSSG